MAGTTRRGLLRALGFGAAAMALPARVWAEKPAAKRTNFVFVLVDDLGWTDLGCFGSSFYDTPNMDKLCASGVKFTNAYAACPVCSPTRGSILTGKYPVRLGITNWIRPGRPGPVDRTPGRNPRYIDRLAHEEVTLPEALKAAGYATFFAGKWHLGPEGFWPEDHGFDVNKGGIERGGPYGGKRYFSPYGNPRLKDGPDGEHLPDRLASETVKFIEANKNKPFLAYLSFYSVHTPLMARADLRAKYEKRRRDRGLEASWSPEGRRKTRQNQCHAVYGGMVEAMDQAVGKVLDALDRLGLTHETVVIFMSDNGGLATSEGHPTSNLPLRAGKGWLYEGGVREPMIIRWPGQAKAGSVCDVVVTSTDFYPTMLEMAGLPAKPDQHRDGLSLAGLLTGRGKLDRKAVYWHYPHRSPQGGQPGGAVRAGDYKFIEFYKNRTAELYNLRDDIGETTNLAAKMPDKAAEMRRMLHAFLKATDAKMPGQR